MKYLILTILALFRLLNLFGQNKTVITTDIDNFWVAYDKIILTKDSAEQYKYLNNIFIEKGSPGLKALMEAKAYTPRSYIEAIIAYPLFWNSVRNSTLKAKDFIPEIETEIKKFKNLYPALKPAKLYFTMGALRTNGTTLNDKVLIGSELALSDKHTISSEFPPRIAESRRTYFDSEPIKSIVLLNVHEYVHTQQKEMAYNLLALCLYEGAAEFLSVIITGKPSIAPAIEYGQTNSVKVKQKFQDDVFKTDKVSEWLWSDSENEFKVRDLGYFIGYTLCEIFYTATKNKKEAIHYLLELDYNNDSEVEKFVDGTHYFLAPLAQLRESFEKKRPVVIGIEQFQNGSKQVSPTTSTITVNFSSPLDKEKRGFDYGPLGEKNVLRVKQVIGFSENGKSFSFVVELKPNERYQSLLTARFQTPDGIPLKPFLIDVTTADH